MGLCAMRFERFVLGLFDHYLGEVGGVRCRGDVVEYVGLLALIGILNYNGLYKDFMVIRDKGARHGQERVIRSVLAAIVCGLGSKFLKWLGVFIKGDEKRGVLWQLVWEVSGRGRRLEGVLGFYFEDFRNGFLFRVTIERHKSSYSLCYMILDYYRLGVADFGRFDYVKPLLDYFCISFEYMLSFDVVYGCQFSVLVCFAFYNDLLKLSHGHFRMISIFDSRFRLESMRLLDSSIIITTKTSSTLLSLYDFDYVAFLRLLGMGEEFFRLDDSVELKKIKK